MHGNRIAFVVLLLATMSGAQIAVGPNIHVSQARADTPHLEVVMAADPARAGRLIACSMLSGPGTDTNSAAYVSFDGGTTWKAPVLASERFADDPTCDYGPDGTVFFIAKTQTRFPRHGSDWDALYIRRSPDGGKTWEPAIHSILANDRPFTAIDNSNSPYRGHLYVAFNEHIHGETAGHTADDFRNSNRLATSLDGGNSFRYIADRILLDQGGGQISSSQAASTVVLSDGTVVVLHVHGVMGSISPTTGKRHMQRGWLQVFLSKDGGESLDPPIKVADIQSTYNLADSRGVVGSMAVDHGTGRFKDRLYAVWADVRSGRSEIMFSYSANKGEAWSAPSTINDDRKSDRPSGAPDDFMPVVAVSPAGVVGVQWYDRRDNPDNKGYYARFSASLDGGETWLPSVRVSEAPNSVPTPVPPRGFSITAGDTAGLASTSDGVFHALWIDNRTGVQQVWTAAIRITATMSRQ